MAGWLVVVLLAWILLVLACLALLAAAKRGDAAVEAAEADLGERAPAGPAAGGKSPPASPWPADLDRLASELREELVVDQVMIVARDERTPLGAVAVAAAGMAPAVQGRSFGPRQSVAAAVALSGHAVIAPDHGPLDRAERGGGDAAAVGLSPAGAVAIARLAPGQRLTADDLDHLRDALRERNAEPRLVAAATGALDDALPAPARRRRFDPASRLRSLR